MKTILIAALALVALSAQAAPQEARIHNCLLCHSVDKKVVGPAFNDVAAKYSKDDKDKLTNSILNGSFGKWGQNPMPPNRIPADTASRLADWILSLKK